MIKRKDWRFYIVIAQELGEKITRMFNFIYEVNNDYYILGKDYFRLCTDLEIDVYKGFKDAIDGKEEGFITEQYKRVRKYTSDCQPNSRVRDKELVEFVQRLDEEDLEILSKQVAQAESYAQIAYQ
jgi:hypothetical protein